MIVLHCEQGSHEWDMARLAIPTASRYSDIITPKTLKPSKSAVTYRNQLLAEYVTGYPLEFGYVSPWMERGKDLEPEARAAYELETGASVQRVGFIYRDESRETGCSPDSLVDEDGGLEIKCPLLHTHIGYMLDPDSLVEEYRMQAFGGMLITGRQWWDVYSYHPDLPSVRLRIGRNEEVLDALADALGAFCQDLAAAKTRLAEYRMVEEPA